jgi:hypothetical protein
MHSFCLDDLNCYVGGTTQKYVIPRPSVLAIWPIKEGTDLTQKEVTTLKEARFSLDCNHVQSFFGSQSSSSSILHVPIMNAHNIVWLVDASCWPTTCGGKKVRWPPIFKITHQHTNNWEVNVLLTHALFSPLLMAPQLGMDEFTILFQMTMDMI